MAVSIQEPQYDSNFEINGAGNLKKKKYILRMVTWSGNGVKKLLTLAKESPAVATTATTHPQFYNSTITRRSCV